MGQFLVDTWGLALASQGAVGYRLEGSRHEHVLIDNLGCLRALVAVRWSAASQAGAHPPHRVNEAAPSSKLGQVGSHSSKRRDRLYLLGRQQGHHPDYGVLMCVRQDDRGFDEERLGGSGHRGQTMALASRRASRDSIRSGALDDMAGYVC
jgi:hypothetical protein